MRVARITPHNIYTPNAFAPPFSQPMSNRHVCGGVLNVIACMVCMSTCDMLPGLCTYATYLCPQLFG